jgi:hypothetical protein
MKFKDELMIMINLCLYNLDDTTLFCLQDFGDSVHI